MSAPAPTPVKPDTAPASILPPETPGGTGGQSGNVQHPVPPTQRTIMPFSSTRVESDRWRIDVGMSAPEQVTLRALDADGDVLAEEDFPLEWVRVGGSEQCGGPGEAGPVTLSVP
ncbi:hypothetical protein [uncultured Arthrobacter sp.]|uniref:hypothetical protein n=1 Tax=uncultured Arthrobacter sp. TaxID=114050 RepID=UPI0026134E31|nr:hypothetical protein [uncultured Arthrobacter sp.]